MKEEADLAIRMMTWAVLLPMIPAFLLFWLLPKRTTGEVSGPLHGLQVKFGGSFAAYLVLFLLILWKMPESSSHYHEWTVRGKIEVEKPQTEPAPNLNDVFVRLVPPRLSVMNGGYFTWVFAVAEGSGGRLIFPDLQVDLNGYMGETLPLTRDRPYGAKALDITHDDKERQITIRTPLVLRSLKMGQTYAPTTSAVPKEIK